MQRHYQHELELKLLRQAVNAAGIKPWDVWRPDHQFIATLTKSQIQGMLQEAGLATAEVSRIGGMKKDDAVAMALKRMSENKTWVPRLIDWTQPPVGPANGDFSDEDVVEEGESD